VRGLTVMSIHSPDDGGRVELSHILDADCGRLLMSANGVMHRQSCLLFFML